MATRGRGGGGRASSVLPATRFKVSALAVMRRVRDTGVAVTVTSHGRPLVRIAPLREDAEPTGRGCMVGTCDLLASEIVAFPWRAAQREPHNDAEHPPRAGRRPEGPADDE